MDVIINIRDDGKITTEVTQDPAMMPTATTAETTAVTGLAVDAGASPFAVADELQATQELTAEAAAAIDAGAGPT